MGQHSWFAWVRERVAALGFRSQLLITIGVGVMLLSVTTSVAISWTATQAAHKDFIEQGLRVTEQLADQSALALVYEAPENAMDIVTATLAFPNVSAVELYRPNHQPLLERGVFQHAPASTAWDAEGAVLEIESSRAWYFITPVYLGAGVSDGSPFGAEVSDKELVGYVRLALSKSALHLMTARLFFTNVVISVSFALILVLLLNGVTRRLTNPLLGLAKIMQRAESGETGVRASLGGPTDIQRMERAFNRMMGHLEEREIALKQARDGALASARAKAEFAANVSHELRTPLNGVLGMMQLLKETGLSKQQREYVSVADTSGQTLLALISDILDFSKADASKLELEQIEFSLLEKIENTVMVFADPAHRKSLELVARIADDVPAWVTGDPTRVGQVLSNLLANAIKFTDKGEIQVNVSLVSTRDIEALTRFEVTDSGVGINPEVQEAVFDSFTQADGSTTRQYGGSGLGLSICRQLVELMGGEIGVTSEPGVGSTFWFEVPFVAGSGQGSIGQRATRQLAGMLALVVDEHEPTRGAVADMLRRAGAAETLQAATGGEALALLGREQENRPERSVLAVLGGRFEDMVAMDLARYLRKAQVAGDHRLWVLVSGDREEVTEGLIDDWIDRPIRQTQLMTTLDSLLTGEVETFPPTVQPGRVAVAGQSVLVVEDNRANQMVAEGLLQRLGCEVTVVENGLEAVAAVEAQQFSLVFMDCNMPELDGYGATRAIHERFGLDKAPPIVAMTANTRDEDIQKCRAAGMSDYLGKPVRLDGLRAMLEKWIRVESVANLPTDVEMEVDVAAESGVLDQAVIGDLKEAMGSDFAEVVEAYLEDAATYVDDLGVAVVALQYEQVKRLAHILKGSSKNMGAEHVAGLARALEDWAGAGLPGSAGAQQLLAELGVAFAAVEKSLALEVGLVSGSSAVFIDSDAPLVLIVEDDRSTRISLRRALERDGYRVEEAVNGREAIGTYQSVNPDLVLMDAIMPVMDGFATCASIQGLPGSHHAPILMITALDDEVSVERAFRAGAADFIPKPINLAVLRQRLRRVHTARESEKHVRRLAYHDSLTGLANRTAFQERLQQQLERARRNSELVAVLFLDLDRFKLINDSLGHDVGDELLTQLAERVSGCLRTGDNFARLGGDEFTISLRIASQGSATEVAEKILMVLAAPFHLAAREIFVTYSIGVSLFPEDGATVEDLLKNADAAMYRAKESGGNTFNYYHSEMTVAVSQRLQLEQDLREAVSEGQLVLHYQPQMELSSGRIIGSEALVRWNHPERGLVPPDEFIPMAEDTGIIKALGEWVLRSACAQAQQWQAKGLEPMQISVNVSGRQLREPDFSERVIRCLEETGLEARYLELEITETVIMENAEACIVSLLELRDQGIRIIIDDFGTGYSSLGYLKHFPVSLLKIDRSFVSDIPRDKDDAAITSGVIALARNLGLKVVAEGVETQEQLDFLRAHNCDMIQGYFLSRPLPADRFEEWYRQQSAERRSNPRT
ncbi:MAG: EAL domain-containing protein [Gammaproteobacteria bacterium]|nr:EAL domain-containing protein [Gammaproteobacteria bacterium]